MLAEGARELEAVHHAHRAVEPAPGGLGVGMRAHQEGLAIRARAAEHGAESVDAGVEPRLAHALHQPVAGFDVHFGERLAHDARAHPAELAQRLQVVEQALPVDSHHGAVLPCG